MVTKIAATGYELEIVQRVVEATRTLYDLPDDVSDEMAHFSDRIQEMTVYHWPVAEALVTTDVDDDLPPRRLSKRERAALYLTDGEIDGILDAHNDWPADDEDLDSGDGPDAYPPIMRDAQGRPYDVG